MKSPQKFAYLATKRLCSCDFENISCIEFHWGETSPAVSDSAVGNRVESTRCRETLWDWQLVDDKLFSPLQFPTTWSIDHWRDATNPEYFTPNEGTVGFHGSSIAALISINDVKSLTRSPDSPNFVRVLALWGLGNLRFNPALLWMLKYLCENET